MICAWWLGKVLQNIIINEVDPIFFSMYSQQNVSVLSVKMLGYTTLTHHRIEIRTYNACGFFTLAGWWWWWWWCGVVVVLLGVGVEGWRATGGENIYPLINPTKHGVEYFGQCVAKWMFQGINWNATRWGSLSETSDTFALTRIHITDRVFQILIVKKEGLQCVIKSMHTLRALLCFVVVRLGTNIFAYPSFRIITSLRLTSMALGQSSAPLPVKQPWRIWLNVSHSSTKNERTNKRTNKQTQMKW